MTNLARVVIVPTVTSKIELLCYGYYVDPRPIFVVAKTRKALVNHVVNSTKDKKERYDGETLYYILHIDALIDAIKRLPAVRDSKELTNFKKLLPNILEDYIKSDLEDKLEPVEEVKREITEHVRKTEEEVEEFLTMNQLHLEDDEFFIQESKIQLAAEANAKRVMLKSKMEAEDFLKECEDKKDTSKEDTQCCENCKKVKELEAEIKVLDALVSWIENKAFDYEDEVYRLRKQLNKLL